MEIHEGTHKIEEKVEISRPERKFRIFFIIRNIVCFVIDRHVENYSDKYNSITKNCFPQKLIKLPGE